MRNPAKWMVASLGLVIILIITAFAVANRETIAVSFAPLPWVMDSPLWIAILLSFGIGALFGGLFVWAKAHRSRKRSAERRREIKSIEKQLAVARAQVTKLEAEQRQQQAVLTDNMPVTEQDAA
ncbi:MAG: hypothetical protein CMM46_08290 [Rhodospirillaceae bacterium]|nr:hypothetical protein [Rhodospirillaceae bacterium]|tara:strand:+ start:5386 stop:5757 length:372 start_codon:yes stop_codon:yes gene_type:complete